MGIKHSSPGKASWGSKLRRKGSKAVSSGADNTSCGDIDGSSITHTVPTPEDALAAADAYPSISTTASTSREPSTLLQWKFAPTERHGRGMYERLQKIRTRIINHFGIARSRLIFLDTTHCWFLTSTGYAAPAIPLHRPATIFGDLVASYRPGKRVSVVSPDMSKEPGEVSQHPMVVNKPYIKFIAAVPLLSSVNDHCFGLLSLIDFEPKPILPEAEIDRLREFAAQVAAVVQEDVLEVARSSPGVGDTDTKSITLPTLWIDASSPEWPILRVNTQWEALTGITAVALQQQGGLLDALAPEDEGEAAALRAAVAAALAAGDPVVSLPSIMAPTDPSGAALQFLLAFRAEPDAGPSVCRVEVHARIQGDMALTSASAARELAGAEVARRIAGEPSTSGGSTTGSGTLSVPPGSPSASSSGAFTPVAHSVEILHGSGISVRSTGRPSGPMGSLPSRAASVAVPPRLSGLILGRKLGSGSFGTVYEGALGEVPVAVKVIEAPSGERWESMQWEAKTEAFLAQSMRHENLTRTLDWCFPSDAQSSKIWIVLELCDRGGLSAAIARGALRKGGDPNGPPDMRMVLEVALDVAKGMQYLHEHGLLHADLSSNNVMLVSGAPQSGPTSSPSYRDFVAKVTDFGMARFAGRTASTRTVGTVSHMAPELLSEGLMSQAADVYSFGVIAWELYTGKKAWQKSTLAQVIFQVTVKGATPELPPEAPPRFAALVRRCMALDKEERPTFAEIVPELEAIYAEELEREGEGEMGVAPPPSAVAEQE